MVATETAGGAIQDAFTVVGTVDLGSREANRRAVYVGLRTAQALFDLPGGAGAPVCVESTHTLLLFAPSLALIVLGGFLVNSVVKLVQVRQSLPREHPAEHEPGKKARQHLRLEGDEEVAEAEERRAVEGQLGSAGTPHRRCLEPSRSP